MDARQNALQLFTRFRAEHHGVFLITRDVDAKMFLYAAKRLANKLVDERVRCFAVMAPDWHKEEPISDVVLKSFFALDVQPIPDTSKYVARLAAFPERTMTLHMKKNSSESKHDGHVTATTTFVLGKDIQVHNVQLLNIHQIMTFDELEIPDISRVHLYGCVHMTDVSHVPAALLAEKCTKLSDTQYLIEEIVPITDEMRKRFDIKSLAKQWFLSKAKLGSK
jgi:hypothetical protein